MNFVCFGVPPTDPDFRQGYWLQVYLMTMSVFRADAANRVIFLTGHDVDVSKKIPFSDVLRSRGDVAELTTWRTAAWIEYLRSLSFDRDTVFLDPDVLVQEQPAAAFAGEPFDIGFTHRPTVGQIKDPINAGIVFCPRGGRASACLDLVWSMQRTMDLKRRSWSGDQEAMSALFPPGLLDGDPPERFAIADGLTIGLFPASRWNVSPNFVDGRIFEQPAPILHFKGPRKRQMLPYAMGVLGIELPSE